MLAAIALTPAAPVLVPELAGAAADEVAEFTAAARTAAATLPQRWIAVGVGPADQLIEPAHRGTFAGYGVDLPVALCPDPRVPVSALPAAALFAGWLRGQVNPQGSVYVRMYAAGHSAGAALALGAALRTEIDGSTDPVGVLVVADGANTLTPSAPGGYQPDTEPVQAALDRALAAGDSAALAVLPEVILGRVGYQILAGLAPQPSAAVQLASGAPYGVGYFIGTWTPAP